MNNYKVKLHNGCVTYYQSKKITTVYDMINYLHVDECYALWAIVGVEKIKKIFVSDYKTID